MDYIFHYFPSIVRFEFSKTNHPVQIKKKKPVNDKYLEHASLHVAIEWRSGNAATRAWHLSSAHYPIWSFHFDNKRAHRRFVNGNGWDRSWLFEKYKYYIIYFNTLNVVFKLILKVF